MSTDSDVCRVDGAHMVQFYDSDEHLLGVVASYLTDALFAGDAVVVIAAPPHRRAFSAALLASGVDVAAVTADSRLLQFDAADMLSRFSLGGRLDAVAFEESVAGAVRVAGAGGRPVRAYGEMVALLWEAGDVAGAIQLEGMWNDLGERLPFSLFCAYPHHLFAGPEGARAFDEVCHAHSGVLAGAPVPFGSEVARRFAPGLHAPGLARRFVLDTLRHWDRGDVADEAVVVVAELAANALRHAGSGFVVGLSRHGRTVRVAVGDTSPTAPVARDTSSTAESGRGLQMVSQIALCWGHQAVEGGKVVWAELGGGADARRSA